MMILTISMETWRSPSPRCGGDLTGTTETLSLRSFQTWQSSQPGDSFTTFHKRFNEV